jgi:hypothetical protein
MVRLVADSDNSKKMTVGEGVVGRYRPTHNHASWRVTAAKAMATNAPASARKMMVSIDWNAQ